MSLKSHAVRADNWYTQLFVLICAALEFFFKSTDRDTQWIHKVAQVLFSPFVGSLLGTLLHHFSVHFVERRVFEN